MERPDEQAPFPREPWQRLLEDSVDGPPETTDARIRANARRDLARRGRRWWLPASLAASFVLAVLIVQSEFGTTRRAPMTESDLAGGEAMEARIIDRTEGPAAREAGEPSAAEPARRKSSVRQEAAPEDYGYLNEETGSDEAGIGPRVGGPEHELQAASELSSEAAAVVTDMPAAAAAPAAPPTPEAWYAEIQKLRAEGRIQAAERELERLRKAFPGWLEQKAENLKKEERR
jgi:hypothetical protein